VQSVVRTKLLEAFSKAEGEFLSGQELADIIGCSRTAVWKHMEELRKEGFELEAVRKKGYHIISMPDKVTANEILLGLKTRFMGRKIVHKETVDSTQIEAHRFS